MSGLSAFLKANKKVKETLKYAPSTAFVDENGVPIEFEFKPLTSKANDELRDMCMKSVPVPGKRGQYKEVFDRSKYMALVIAETCTYPNLNSAELQDSYGVKTPDALIKEMIDSPGEYAELFTVIAEYNGFTETASDQVEEVKN